MRHTINAHGVLPNMYGQCTCAKCAEERRADSAKLDAENRVYWAERDRQMAREGTQADDSVGARGVW